MSDREQNMSKRYPWCTGTSSEHRVGEDLNCTECQPEDQAAFGYHFIDADGIDVWIKPSADQENAALVSLYSESFAVRAHELAGFTGGLWAAAKQPVPDLPEIYDPAAVAALVTDLGSALPETQPAIWLPTIAEKLLDAGWRKP